MALIEPRRRACHYRNSDVSEVVRLQRRCRIGFLSQDDEPPGITDVDRFEQLNRQQTIGVAFGSVGDGDSISTPHRAAIDLDPAGDGADLQYSGYRDELLGEVRGPHAKPNYAVGPGANRPSSPSRNTAPANCGCKWAVDRQDPLHPNIIPLARSRF